MVADGCQGTLTPQHSGIHSTLPPCLRFPVVCHGQDSVASLVLYGAELLQFGADESETMGTAGYEGSQEAALLGILALPL